MTSSINSSSSTKVPVIQADPQCSGKHKMRLLVGEGNFSFALALINKHDNKYRHNSKESLAHSIVATEYKSDITCDNCESSSNRFVDENPTQKPESAKESPKCEDCESATGRVKELEARGAHIYFEIDGTQLNNYEDLNQYHFPRIHWNCPHDGSDYKEQTLPVIIKQFFKACSAIQYPEDQVHITLAQPVERKKFYQGYYYDITLAACTAGYTLIKKRNFDRYEGYIHTQTKKSESAKVIEQGMREFVFKKIDCQQFARIFEQASKEEEENQLGVLASKLQEHSTKQVSWKTDPQYGEVRGYYECSTDDDSSDYEYQ